MSAQLVINQAGLPVGTVNQARSDGLHTGLVTLSSVGPGDTHEFELLWAPDDDATAASSFVQNTTTTATFSPDPSSVGGTYRIKLTVTLGDTVSTVIRCFAILTSHGLRIPALNERANERATLANGSTYVAESEFNEPGSGPFTGGNYGGWYSALAKIARTVEAGGGGGTLAGDVTGASGANTVIKLQGRAVNSTAPTTGYALVWNGSAWAPAAVSASSIIMGGDVSGSSASCTVGYIQGKAIAVPTTTSTVATYDGTSIVWSPVSGTGDMVGPAGAVADRIFVSNGTTGKLAKDGGKTLADIATDYNAAITSAISAIGWKTALDLNLYSDADFTFVNGANTWHGVTWTGKNIASAADIFAVQNGVGLVIDPNAVASEWFVANDTYPAIYARLLDLIPGYVPGQTRVRTRAMWTVTNSNAAYEYAGFAVERLPFVASQRLHWGCLQGYDPAHAGGTGYDCMQRTIRAASAAQRHSNVAKNAQMLDLQGAQLANFYKANIAAPATDPNSTAIPTSIFSLTAEWSYSQQATLNGGFTTTADADGRVVPYASDPGDLCLVLGAQTGNITNSFSATFTRLIVEYKN